MAISGNQWQSVAIDETHLLGREKELVLKPTPLAQRGVLGVHALQLRLHRPRSILGDLWGKGERAPW